MGAGSGREFRPWKRRALRENHRRRPSLPDGMRVRCGRPRRSLLAGHLCLWGLALLCKETAVLVPVAGILLLWSRRAWSAMRWPALWIGWLGIAGAWL